MQLGQTLAAWSEEIVAMWRFTRNNGITEGFHNIKWSSSIDKFTASATSRTIDFVSRYHVLGFWGSGFAPINDLEPTVSSAVSR